MTWHKCKSVCMRGYFIYAHVYVCVYVSACMCVWVGGRGRGGLVRVVGCVLRAPL